ncbi:MAG TPA: PQQ-binding-like beta-propeller repeat protein [Vicinamibacterales bacterium]|nr:PQQ-binding-like beta-propeller repeat protein [Vicinamibacterales bacterium]
MTQLIARIAASLALVLGFAGLVHAQAPDGAELYKRTCAMCHDTGANRAPNREAFTSMPAERVLSAMESGSMITMANGRTAAERRVLAEFLTGKSLSNPLVTAPSPAAMCAASFAAFNPAVGPRWTGWGQNTNNTRFQDAEAAGVAASDVPRLKLKWAFAFPGDLQSYSQSTIAGGRVFVGSWGGKVYSLSAATGCVHWFFDAGQGVRSAVSVGRVGSRDVAVFGDMQANVYALDATTGRLLWKTDVDDFPVGRISGSPTLYNGRIYVGIASGEEATGANPAYECCKFRGNVVALDAATGRRLWKTYTIDTPRQTKKNAVGTQLWGPSGAPVWATPVVDARLNRLYVTTGNNYSDPPSSMSDAFLALDIDSGKILWSRQMTEKDAYTAACRLPDKTNCADSNGPDFDFGASPILITLANGRRMLVAGQKSGIVHALDPDKGGEVLWQTRVGRGGTMGGVQWGSAADQSNVYVALSDIGRIMLNYSNSTDADPKQGGGMFALRLEDGERVWYTPPPGCGTRQRCSPAQSAAVSAMPGVAFSGSVDGHMRAYSAADGKILWDFDTIRAYDTVNGVPGRGGSIDGPGPSIGGGMVFVNSGYPTAGGTPGNVLLAFSVDGK